MAKPLMAPEPAMHKLDSSILKKFIAENYTAPRMVLVASGVEHDVLVSIAEPLLSDLPAVKRPEEPKSVYVGGDYRCQADCQNTHVALAFEVPGGWDEEKTAIIVTVLQMLMGGWFILYWRSWEGLVFSIISPDIKPVPSDRIILCFQSYLQPFWSFWNSCNNQPRFCLEGCGFGSRGTS